MPALLAVGVALGAAIATPLQAQDGNAIRNTLRNSGLSADDIRTRLSSLGYDPRTLDAYLGGDASAAAPAPSASALGALRALGVQAVDPALLAPGAPAPTPATAPPVLPPASAEERREDLRVFGIAVFSRSTTQFQPLTTGPVPGSYMLGPGDELVLIMTGDVEASYALPVTRDGFIVIPRVGQVPVTGLTLDRLRDQLYGILGRAYSGVRRGPGGTTRFELTLGNLRTNQVFITGDVAQPGSYLVSPVASVLNALYLAGGPTAAGAFRDVQIVRGGRAVHHVDLYAYLLRGNNMDSIRLQPGDVIFVPGHGTHVAVRGQVSRPAIYELAEGENLYHLLRNAGGLTTPAHLKRARITRILPAANRTTPGLVRVAIDVGLDTALADSTRAPRLFDRDEVDVFAADGDVRNTVTISGPVWRDGSYEFRPGMRAWDLIRLADGLRPVAYLPQGQILRLEPYTRIPTLLRFSLDTTAAGAPVENPALQEFDEVRLFDRTASLSPDVVIAGEVFDAGPRSFREGMTLRDLVLAAGGLRPDAHLEVEIARLAASDQRVAGSMAEIIRLRLDSTYIVSDEARRRYLGSPDSLLRDAAGAAAAFRLQPFDRIDVRRLAYLTLPRTVVITGQVLFPGRYVLTRRGERLSDLVSRAGGVRPEAHPPGARFFREGRAVNVHLDRVLRDGRDDGNVVLELGDSLDVPALEPVVLVQGAVNSPTAVLYREGAGLGYYIATAGGYNRIADEGRTFVRQRNGATEVRRRRLFIFRTSPEPGPGSVVTVPSEDPNNRFDWRGFLSDVVQIVASVSTIIIVASR